MKKLFDGIFLSLPPLVGTIVIAIMQNYQLQEVSTVILLISSILAVSGVIRIIFYKSVANTSAEIHSAMHSIYYKEDTDAGKDDSLQTDTNISESESIQNNANVDEGNTDSEIVTRKFVPTAAGHAKFIFLGLFCYGLSLFLIVAQVQMLK